MNATLCFLKTWIQHLTANSKDKDRNYVL